VPQAIPVTERGDSLRDGGSSKVSKNNLRHRQSPEVKVFQIDLSRFEACDTIGYGSQKTENCASESPSHSSQSRDGKTSAFCIGPNSRIREGQSLSQQREQVAGIRHPGTLTHYISPCPIKTEVRLTPREALRNGGQRSCQSRQGGRPNRPG
jgi:hypothetical protein